LYDPFFLLVVVDQDYFCKDCPDKLELYLNEMYFFLTFLALVKVTWDWLKKVVQQVDDLSFLTFLQKSEKK